MGWEGQKEGFASIRVKPAKGRSGIITWTLFFAHEVGNPMMISLYRTSVPAGASKIASMTSTYSTNVA